MEKTKRPSIDQAIASHIQSNIFPGMNGNIIHRAIKIMSHIIAKNALIFFNSTISTSPLIILLKLVILLIKISNRSNTSI